MKLGIQIGAFAWAGGPARLAENLITLVRTADDAGFDLIGFPDHVWQGEWMGGVEQPMLELFASFGAIAVSTRRARLAPMVLGAHFRHPAIIAKGITTLDILSGGRAMLGIGAGWYEEEARGLGIPYPSVGERFELLEDAVQLCLGMWRGERGEEAPFRGRHVQAERLINSPQSLARPHPPILIGGGGEQVTLRLVARYADACNLYPTPELPHKLDVLRRHCEAEGRDYDAIEKTVSHHFAVGEQGEKVGELIEGLRGLAGHGIETVIGIVHGADPARTVAIVGEQVMPAVADL
jgi:F420-dependent oxidoreductase-like protein